MENNFGMNDLPMHNPFSALSLSTTSDDLIELYRNLSESQQHQFLNAIITISPLSHLSFIHRNISTRLRLNPTTHFPFEILLQIFGYLDATALCRSATVSREWKKVAESEKIWVRMVHQHCGKRCKSCGLGFSESSSKSIMRSPKLSDEPAICEDSDGLETDTKKRKRSDSESSQTQPTRMCISQPDDQAISSLSSSSSQPSPILPLQSEHPKSIFLNGLRLEQNWRHGRYTVSSIQGSRQGIRSLCYVPRENGGELFTGGYDKIIRRYFISDFTLKTCKSESGVLATNAENSNPSFISSETVLLGHDGVVTCLRTYQNHLLSASSDRTIKIWSLKTLQLMKTLIGHMEKVTCLKGFEEGVVSAAEGGGVRVWRRAAGPAGGIGIGRRLLIGETVYDLHVEVRRNRSAQHSVPNTASWPESNNSSNAGSQPALGWDGMILILALESGVLIWDLETNVRIKLGDHVGSVQCVKYIETEEDKHQLSTPDDDEVGGSDSVFTTTNTPHDMNTAVVIQGTGGVNTIPLNGTLISCSTDGTIKYYELSSNRTPQLSKTLYGHVNGIWSLAHDSLRLISVGFGGLVRVWELDTGRSMYGLDGHRSSVNVVEMGGEKVFTADDDGIIKIWDFSPDRTKYLNRSN